MPRDMRSAVTGAEVLGLLVLGACTRETADSPILPAESAPCPDQGPVSSYH